MKKFELWTLWAMTHMPLSWRTVVEAKAEDYLGITSQEVDPSLDGNKVLSFLQNRPHEEELQDPKARRRQESEVGRR